MPMCHDDENKIIFLQNERKKVKTFQRSNENIVHQMQNWFYLKSSHSQYNHLKFNAGCVYLNLMA